LAVKQQTGARALVSVVENVLLPFEKKLPSTGIKFLIVNVKMVANPEKELEDLLANAKRRDFHRRHFGRARKKRLKGLIDFLKSKKTDYLAGHGMRVTSARLALLAGYIFDESIDPARACDDFLMLDRCMIEWQEKIFKQCGVRVKFSEDAVDYCLALEPKTRDGIDALCGKLLKAAEYGLVSLEHTEPPAQIIIPATGMVDPKKFINELIAGKLQRQSR